MSPVSPASALASARDGIRRNNLRRDLEAVAIGKKKELALDLDDRGVRASAVINEMARHYSVESIERQRLIAAFRNSGTADALIERLTAKGLSGRRQSAEVIGALRLTEAIAWLAPLLASSNRPLSEAAARALGRIGGVRSAQILMHAILRGGLRRTFVTELARAAPDLFIEAALSARQISGVNAGLALSAGLRRRQTAVGPLLALLMAGGQRERAIACRALGWIGSQAAVPGLIASLDDPEWKVRLSAAKALRRIRPQAAVRELELLLSDRNVRVRLAAGAALRRAVVASSVAV